MTRVLHDPGGGVKFLPRKGNSLERFHFGGRLLSGCGPLVRSCINTVMPGRVPGIHALAAAWYWGKDVDGRDEPGHDVRLFAVDPPEASVSQRDPSR
ncbi:hypothetical protein FO470_00235 [Starkeya sp. 3C]|uniref:Uncharacterized protein n=1 Tax=Ancylobacter moscoviensis TaxID=2597768 RepID=A0ABY3DUE6_9HYPH|nr:hypothetical protein FO470_00235 [Ancylobacter moscoviensis]